MLDYLLLLVYLLTITQLNNKIFFLVSKILELILANLNVPVSKIIFILPG